MDVVLGLTMWVEVGVEVGVEVEVEVALPVCELIAEGAKDSLRLTYLDTKVSLIQGGLLDSNLDPEDGPKSSDRFKALTVVRASSSSLQSIMSIQLPPSLDLPPHLSAHKYFFVCTLTVAAWDTLVLSPRTWRLLKTPEWPALKILFHILRILMPVEFAIVGTNISPSALLLVLRKLLSGRLFRH